LAGGEGRAQALAADAVRLGLWDATGDAVTTAAASSWGVALAAAVALVRRASEPLPYVTANLRGERVVGYFGNQGAGKTYSMVRDALAERVREPRLRIASNMPLLLPVGRPAELVEGIDQLEELRDCLLLLDEAHTMLNSRTGTSGERLRVLTFLSQLRKRRVWLRYTSQTSGKVDKQLRDMTEVAHRLTSVRKLGFFFRSSWDGTEPKAGSLGKGFVKVERSVYAAYDTTAIVAAGGWFNGE